MVAKDDALVFVSMSGSRYAATLMAMHGEDRCSIEVDVGTRDKVPLTMVRLREHPTGEIFVAWPKEAKGGSEREAEA